MHWARTSQPGAAKHLPCWFKYVWQILADIIPSQVTSVCQSAQNWHKYHIVHSGYFNRNVIVCLGQIWIQHAQEGAPAVPKSHINEAGSGAMGISCMLWILRSGSSLWKWLFQNNHERPYYFFFRGDKIISFVFNNLSICKYWVSPFVCCTCALTAASARTTGSSALHHCFCPVQLCQPT